MMNTRVISRAEIHRELINKNPRIIRNFKKNKLTDFIEPRCLINQSAVILLE